MSNNVNIRIKPKMISIFLLIGVLPIISFAIFSGYLSKQSLVKESFENLSTIQQLKKIEVEEKFSSYIKNIKTVSQTVSVNDIIEFENRASNNDPVALASMLQDDKMYFDSFFPAQERRLANFIRTYNYKDIYIIDPKIGTIMYTVHDIKSRGLNVSTGEFKDTTFFKTWKKASSKGRVVMSDFDVMSASDQREIAFIAYPIWDKNGQKEAILIISYDVKLVTDIVHSQEGLGETGESYIVGWQENTDTFELRSDISARYGENLRIGSTIDATEYWKLAFENGLQGGKGIFLDTIGHNVLVVYNKLDLEGLEWFFITKIDQEEVIASLRLTYYLIAVFLAVISVIVIVAAWLVANNFTNPIIKEMKYANAIAHGEFGTELDCNRSDELGDLGRSLQNMSDKLFEIDWIRTKQEDLDNLLRGNQKIQVITKKCIDFFVKNLSASVGAIYINNADKLELKASHAFSNRAGNFSSFNFGEGLVGQAALEDEVLFFSKIDDGPSYNYGVGKEEMQFFVAAPLSKDGEIIAVILLGSVEEFPALEKKFIKENVDNIAILFNAATSREHITMLLNKSQQQQKELQKSNEQLEEQKLNLQASEAELQAQQEELRVTNDELAEQTKALQASEEELQAEQEELRVTNEELATKSTDLENQQKTIATKNSELEEAKIEVERRMVEVERASKYKSEFLSNMSHELRTPLNSILILSQLLGNNKTGNLTEKQTTSANAINASGADLLNLINEILDLSKIESGKIELNVEKLTFKQIEDDLNRLYNEIATQKGLSFLVNKDENLPENFSSDNQRLQQVLRNLVSNALKFTSKGEVSVGITLADNNQLQGTILEGKPTLCFAVKDDGIGIPKDKHDDVFMAFQQADGSTSRKFGGTGLGLSISKELTKILGGFLVLDSAENVGSTFSIFIPVTFDGTQEASSGMFNSQAGKAQGNANPVGMTNVARSPIAPTAQLPQVDVSIPELLFEGEHDLPDDRGNIKPDSKSLLIIEDDKSFAKVLMDFGREKGFDCIHAGDGETGLHFADYYLPSGIILDIGLPGISGWEVMERLKENRKLRHIPVHFMSAEDSSMDAMRMGAVGFLTKPISIEKIEDTISKLEHLSSTPVRKLLLVEDDKLQQDSIKELIGDNDVETTAVGTGKEAYKLLTESSFDCIVLDLGLEDMSGFELLEKIRGNDSLQKTPIIIYTGRDLSREEEAKLTKYADSIIIKGAKSPERLLDESALFLHRVEANLPEEKRQMLKQIHDKESILNGITLLVVDDDMRNIFALTSILEEREIDVIVAKDGVEALEKLEENIDIIDGVLMDIMMPNMDGYEAMTKIRKEMRLTKLPMIALTAKAMKDDRMKCIDAGANDYLAKPIDQEKLISMLKVWLYR